MYSTFTTEPTPHKASYMAYSPTTTNTSATAQTNNASRPLQRRPPVPPPRKRLSTFNNNGLSYKGTGAAEPFIRDPEYSQHSLPTATALPCNIMAAEDEDDIPLRTLMNHRKQLARQSLQVSQVSYEYAEIKQQQIRPKSYVPMPLSAGPAPTSHRLSLSTSPLLNSAESMRSVSTSGRSSSCFSPRSSAEFSRDGTLGIEDQWDDDEDKEIERKSETSGSESSSTSLSFKEGEEDTYTAPPMTKDNGLDEEKSRAAQVTSVISGRRSMSNGSSRVLLRRHSSIRRSSGTIRRQSSIRSVSGRNESQKGLEAATPTAAVVAEEQGHAAHAADTDNHGTESLPPARAATVKDISRLAFEYYSENKPKDLLSSPVRVAVDSDEVLNAEGTSATTLVRRNKSVGKRGAGRTTGSVRQQRRTNESLARARKCFSLGPPPREAYKSRYFGLGQSSAASPIREEVEPTELVSHHQHHHYQPQPQPQQHHHHHRENEFKHKEVDLDLYTRVRSIIESDHVFSLNLRGFTGNDMWAYRGASYFEASDRAASAMKP